MESYILEFGNLPSLFHARMNVNIIRRLKQKKTESKGRKLVQFSFVKKMVAKNEN